MLQQDVIEWYIKVLYNEILSPHTNIPLSEYDKDFIMQEAKIIGSEWYVFREPMTVVGIFFLLMSLVAAFGVRRIENWLELRKH